MISEKELEYLYKTSLENQLLSLEPRRKNMKSYVYACIGLLILIVISIFTTINNPSSNTIIVTIILFIGLISLGIYVFYRNKKYKKLFKKNIVSKIVKAFNPEWTYSPEKSISQEEYENSGLFPKKVHKYSGDDLIEGSINSIKFSCSEIHSEYNRIEHDNDSSNKTKWVTIFKGLFFHADFETLFDGTTHIKSIGRQNKSKKITSQEEHIKIPGHKEFNRLFDIYSTNPIEAKRILNPSMIEALLKIKTEYKNPINVIFSDNRVHLTVSFKKDLFEPRILKSGVNYEDILFIYKLLNLNHTIVNELKF